MPEIVGRGNGAVGAAVIVLAYFVNRKGPMCPLKATRVAFIAPTYNGAELSYIVDDLHRIVRHPTELH